MYCSRCGTQNDDASKFCRSCGLDLSHTTPVAALRDQQIDVTELDLVREQLKDFVLVLQLLPHQIQLGNVDLLVAQGGDWSRVRQIQSAGAAEFAGVVVLGAAAGAVHQISEGSRKLRDLSDAVSTRDSAPRAQKSEASAAYTCGRRAAPDGGAASGCATPRRTDRGKS